MTKLSQLRAIFEKSVGLNGEDRTELQRLQGQLIDILESDGVIVAEIQPFVV